MKILVATDSFKGTLTAARAAEVIRDAFLEVCPDCAADVAPVADGGEGTVDALLAAIRGEKRFVQATAPQGNRVESFYGVFG
ncbi:MAG TPA: glycerate kinase, partial [Clostridiales bacterium]|nr:glycerate kinase [Clostridiales bacterium]